MESFPKALHILGDDSDVARQRSVDEFQDNPKEQLLIASIKAAGIGITLTAASHVAFVEVGWTPADQDQAEDRLHRIGQVWPVNVYYLVATNTIEEEIIDIIDSKRRVVTKATEGVDASQSGVVNALISRLLKRHNYDK